MDAAGAGVGLIAGVWSESAAAERALHAFRVGGSVGSTEVLGAVTLVVDPFGDLRITDRAGRAGEGAVGGLLGATLGLFTSGTGWLPSGTDAPAAGTGRGSGQDGQILRLGDRMTRRSSALVAVVRRAWLDVAVVALEATGAETVPEPVDDVLLARLSDQEPAWSCGAELGDVVAVRSGAVVMRALEGSAATLP